MILAKIAKVVIIVTMLFFSSNVPVVAANTNLWTGKVWCNTGTNFGGSLNLLNSSSMSNNPQVNTALGCIPIRLDKFVEWLLPPMFGIAGGISFLLMIYGFFLMTVSSGDPKAVQGAWETITSAISGLVVCIFSIFILRLITVGILKIPGIN